jgi:hypothetical protein
LVVGFRAGLHVFDGDFYNEFSATDILLGPGDLCSNVILIERRQFDVHAFGHNRFSSDVRSRCGYRCFAVTAKAAFASPLTIEAVAGPAIDI